MFNFYYLIHDRFIIVYLISILLFLVQPSYPLNTLNHPALKKALMSEIVSRFVDRPQQVLAWRVLWRLPQDQIDDAWLGIAEYRKACDRTVTDGKSTLFFFSSISGVYTKTVKKQNRVVHPAISYWLLLDDTNTNCQLQLPHLIQQYHDQFPVAEVKEIVSRRGSKTFEPVTNAVDSSCQDSQSAPSSHCDTGPDDPSTSYNTGANPIQWENDAARRLFIVLKDLQSSFVRDKVECSAKAMGLTLDSSPVTRVVVSRPDLYSPLSQALANIRAQTGTRFSVFMNK